MTFTPAESCNGRGSAARGSTVWCRCSSRGDPIQSKRICETSDGGRNQECMWSLRSLSCVRRSETHFSSTYASQSAGSDGALSCHGRQGAARGSEVWCRCNSRGEPVGSRAVCETKDGGRNQVCMWSVDSNVCALRRIILLPPNRASQGDGTVGERSCDGRQAAARGSNVWCRCNGRGEPIRSKAVCETSDGGRYQTCKWSLGSLSCVPRTQTLPSSAARSNGVGSLSAGGQVRGVGCPHPRGNISEWSKQLSRAEQHLTVATWNVEWLFDGINDPVPVPKWIGSPQDALARIRNVAEVMRRINADIFHLAEVENCKILSRIASELNSSYEPFLIEGTDSALRQQVGLLSRLRPMQDLSRSSGRAEFPIGGSKCGYTDSARSTGVSKHLISSFSPIPGHEILLVGLHLKAGATKPASCAQREAQAGVIRGLLLDALQEGKHVIVLGDFNDFDPDVPGSDGQAPTSSVLRMFKDLNDDGQPDLWNVLEMMPRYERYTNWFDRNHDGILQSDTEKSLLDHILISNSLRRLVDSVGIDHQHHPKRLSDHWPVWVRFNLSPWAHAETIQESLTGSDEAVQHIHVSDSWAANLQIVPLLVFTLLGLVLLVKHSWRHYSKKDASMGNHAD